MKALEPSNDSFRAAEKLINKNPEAALLLINLGIKFGQQGIGILPNIDYLESCMDLSERRIELDTHLEEMNTEMEDKLYKSLEVDVTAN